MNPLILIVLMLGGAGFLYALVYKPELIGIFFFTLVIADINLEVKGVPLNLRALVSIALLGRILTDKQNTPPLPFFSAGYTINVLVFLIYSALVSMNHELLSFEMLKQFFLMLVSAYCGYYFLYKNNGYFVLKTSLLLSGFICLADLTYTYAVAGEFPVQRIYIAITGGVNLENHNYFGYVCGISFVFLLQDFLEKKNNNKVVLFALPLMFLGLIMSTSRSSILIVIIFCIFLIGRALKSAEKGKKIYNLIGVTLGCFFLSLYIFESLHGLFNISDDFLEKITSRMIDEPIAVFNKHLGYNYNSQALDSMEWREEASSLAYDVYMNLPTSEQFFGIGFLGFVARDYGHGYDAHNGVLRLLIETGIFGFIIYFYMILSIIKKMLSLKLLTPVLSTLVFIIYTVGHNNEMVSAFAFIIIGTLIGEIKFYLARDVNLASGNSIAADSNKY
jgi:O-antigen ligase